MNKKIFMLGMVPMLAVLLPSHVLALSDNERYNQGYVDGGNQAASDWNSHVFTISSGGNSQCPDGHSHSYCEGFNAGYADEWNRSIQVNYGTQTQQVQGSDVNIKGNNNRVTVQQGQSTDSGGGSGDGGGSNPTCRVLCGSINVR